MQHYTILKIQREKKIIYAKSLKIEHKEFKICTITKNCQEHLKISAVSFGMSKPAQTHTSVSSLIRHRQTEDKHTIFKIGRKKTSLRNLGGIHENLNSKYTYYITKVNQKKIINNVYQHRYTDGEEAKSCMNRKSGRFCKAPNISPTQMQWL